MDLTGERVEVIRDDIGGERADAGEGGLEITSAQSAATDAGGHRIGNAESSIEAGRKWTGGAHRFTMPGGG
ncbi:MAG: hypothetical protein WBA87_11320 [Microbacterium sp.]